MKNKTEHWNRIFNKVDDEKLGWYEKDFSQTVKYLDLIPDWKNSKIFVPGVGTSGLIGILSKSNAELILNDLSSEAIEKARNKYSDPANTIKWLCHDISDKLPEEYNNFDIWLDRAVLHFLDDDSCVEQYFRNVNSTVKVGGHALFFEFSKKGVDKCAGLKVRRYDVQDLEKHLPTFELIASEEYTYINPMNDPRPYIYALFRRK